jgi:uncharacterized membrane protein YeaQ/YmgE (transglycosylase-associated protein family)
MLIGPVVWILVGLIAGWAAGKIMKGSGYGVIVDILLGMVGAIVGEWLMGLVGIYSGSLIGTTLIAIVGAIFVIWLSRVLKRA